MSGAGQPLAGKRILVTRARQQAGRLAEALEEQGAEVLRLPTIEIIPPETWADLDAVLEQAGTDKRRVVLVLDQLSDPHNVGAILRTAAAFGVTAVVVQDRHAPPQSGALAKAASGALESVPYIEVVNIARVLDQLAERGFWRIALAGDGAQPLTKVIPEGDVALVLGSEGDGIRRLVREHCEAAAFIPIARPMESLNVSNAAAIALYELRRGTSA